MKITQITPQKKNQQRLNVYLEGEFAFGLSANLLFEKKLSLDQELTQSEIDQLLISDQVRRLIEKSLRFLSYRPRSEKEIRDYFVRRGKLADLEKSLEEQKRYQKSVEKVIEKLKEMGQINDQAFAQWWVEQRKRFNPKGTRVLRVELRQKGIENSVISTILDKYRDTLSDALKIMKKKLKTLRGLSPLEFKQKLAHYLLRRGFEWQTVKEAVDTLGGKK